MKIYKIIAIIIIMAAATIVRAESIFLKDGSIVEGTITKETDRAATVKSLKGKIVTIPKKDILRVIFDDEYKNRVYIHKTDGIVIEAYIVNEDRDTYTYRTDLALANETVINKKQVNFISKHKQAIIQKEKKKEEPLAKQIYDRFISLKLGPLFTMTSSSYHPEGTYSSGFEFGIGFYDQIFETEMSMAMGFFERAEPSIFFRINSNFVFGNIMGFGLGFFTSGSKQERGLFYPNMDMINSGMIFGPVLRIPNIMHVSFFMMIPFGSNLNYYFVNDSQYEYRSNFNFNMLLSVDVFVWKTLTVGFTYILEGGVYKLDADENSGNLPTYSEVAFYSHKIVLNVSYGFNL